MKAVVCILGLMVTVWRDLGQGIFFGRNLFLLKISSRKRATLSGTAEQKADAKKLFSRMM